MPRWIIQETATYYDEYEVEAPTREVALERHRAGESNACGGMSVSDGELVCCEQPIYYVGPESKVYHTDTNCPRLYGRNRYYSRSYAVGSTADRIKRERRLCATCSGAPNA
jgi:hypothetical protein